MRRIVLILSVLLALSGLVQAQNAGLPLVLEIDGDIWTWKPGDTELNRLTEWGYNGDLVVSPDGTQVAYYSIAQIVVEAIQREGGFGGGKLPGNIWVMDTVTGEAYRTADQPADASFFTAGVPDKAIVRSTPMWSPDGASLAWTEYDYGSEAANPLLRLVVFDTASKTAQVIVDDLPFPAGVPAAMNGDWTEAGFFLYHYTADPNTGNLANSLLVYSTTGERLTQLFYNETPDRIVGTIIPARHAGVTNVAALMVTISSGQREWQVIDPLASGAEWQPAPVVPERVAGMNPANSLRLMWSPAPGTQNYPDTATVLKDGSPVSFELAENTWIFQPTLSPDGKAVAFTIFDPQAVGYQPGVYVWKSDDNSLLSVPVAPEKYVHQILWGSTVWEMRE